MSAARELFQKDSLGRQHVRRAVQFKWSALALAALLAACTLRSPSPVEPEDAIVLQDAVVEFVFRYPDYAQIGYYFEPPLIEISRDGVIIETVTCWPVEPILVGKEQEVVCLPPAPLALESEGVYEWRIIPGGCERSCEPSTPHRFIWLVDDVPTE